MLHLSEFPGGLHKPLTELDVLLLHVVCKLLLTLLCHTDAAAEHPQTSLHLSQHRCEQAK